MTTHTSSPSAVAEILDELGPPQSLGSVVAGIDGLQAAVTSRRSVSTTANVRNLLVTSSGLGSSRTAVAHPGLVDAPLLAAVTGVDGSDAFVSPFSVTPTDNSAVTAEGAALPESALVYAAGSELALPTLGHSIPVTRQAVRHNQTLRADVDAFLSGALLAQLEQAVADAIATAPGVVVHAHDTNLATTARTAIAAAQMAQRFLGPGVVTLALSPDDHAALDLAGFDLSQWPAKVVSSPALPSGFAYAGRLKLAVQLFAAPILVDAGYVDAQFIENKLTVRATVQALAHVAAPGAIVKADLTAA